MNGCNTPMREVDCRESYQLAIRRNENRIIELMGSHTKEYLTMPEYRQLVLMNKLLEAAIKDTERKLKKMEL
jgi:hypothetical protein